MPKIEFRSDMQVTYIDHMGDDKRIAQAARVSTGTDDSDRPHEGLVKRLWADRHACYDGETEVLTRSGWKHWAAVGDGDEFLSLDLSTGTSEYATPTALHEFDYSGDMVKIDGAGIDALVTPNHNLVAELRDGRTRGWKPASLVRADEAIGGAFRVPRAAGRIEGQAGTVGEAAAELLGFTTGDGHVPRAPRHGSPTFHLHKQRKVDYLRDLCERTGSVALSGGECGKFLLVGVPANLKRMMQETYAEDSRRRVPPDFLANATAEEAEAFIRGYLAADGHLRRDRGGSVSFSCAGDHLIDGVAQLAATVGECVVIGKPQTSYGEWTPGGSASQRALMIADRNKRGRIGWTRGERANQVSVQQYDGKVYCATVPHGTLYVRRNGKPYWSGNSPFEHNVLTVKVEVPIFVAREWMRHRTQAFNEISGRYTEMRPVFYTPSESRPLVQVGKAMDYRREAGSPILRAVTDRLMRVAGKVTWRLYEYLLRKGVAREVARNVLPLSLYTQFYATANLRNWLHFVELRTDPTALGEIREAALMVEDIIADLWPVTHAAYREGAES